MYLNVNDRELATILAALRLWQEQDAPPARQFEIATEHGEPMDGEAIDALCERLNTEDHELQLLALPGQLLSALERAVAANDPNGESRDDYDWVGEADRAVAAAKAAGIQPIEA